MRRLIIELKTTDGSFRQFPFNITTLRKQEEYMGKKRPTIELQGIKHTYVMRSFNTSSQRDLVFTKIFSANEVNIFCDELFGDRPDVASIERACSRYGPFFVKRALALLNHQTELDILKAYPILKDGLLPAELEWFALDAARTLPYPKDIRDIGISPFTFYKKILCV